MSALARSLGKDRDWPKGKKKARALRRNVGTEVKAPPKGSGF